jgi:glycosyltransferase involved in cell wall biosynthesis
VPSKVAVLVAAHDAEKSIRDAVESVLAGSMPCRVTVVDDGSRIPVTQVLGTYGGRVEIIRLDENRGSAVARNVGLARILARDVDFVAIQDAHDLSYADRLATQVAAFKANARLGAVGSWTRHFDAATGATTVYRKHPTDAAAIRNLLYFDDGIPHASAMFRADALRAIGGYAEDYPAAEDYELLRRIATHFELGNVPEFLVACRLSTLGRHRHQLLDRLRVQLGYLEPTEWRAWAGALHTVAHFVMPGGMTAALARK